MTKEILFFKDYDEKIVKTRNENINDVLLLLFLTGLVVVPV